MERLPVETRARPPELRTVLEGLAQAARSQTLLLSALERGEATFQDPRDAFCGDFAAPEPRARRRAKKPPSR
jgi:hypothetical protein